MKQPTKTTCGQTCVAKFLGIEPETIIAEIGGSASWPSMLRKALENHGHTLSKCKYKLPVIPQEGEWLALVQWVVNHKLIGHWFFIRNGLAWCPTNDDIISLNDPAMAGKIYEITKVA